MTFQSEGLDPQVAQASVPATMSIRTVPPMAWFLLAVAFALLYALYFLPALSRHSLLAPGDGEIYYLPFFGLKVTEFWNDLLLSGYPVVSDIQAQTFYPLRWLSPTFNVLVMSAYVVAALGSFGLALNLTGSRLGALFAALVVSGSGFLMGHLGHLSIIHSAAWTPWMLWAISCLRRDSHWAPAGLGAVAVALAICGGHPQVAIIGMLLAGSFGLNEAFAAFHQDGRREGALVLAKVTAIFILGLAIASPALVGLLSSASSGVRAAWSIADFGSFSHDFSTLRMLAFPNLYGAQAPGPYGAYLGPYNLTELVMYAGIAPAILVVAALIDLRKDRQPLFWAAMAFASLVLALGTSTFVGNLVFKLPVLGQFRAQARFGWIFIICVAVLSAYGLSAILRRGLSRGQILATLLLSAGLMLVVVASVAIAPTQSLTTAGSSWYQQLAFVAPILLMGSSLLLVGLTMHRPSHGKVFVLFALLIVDLASFGWFHDWRYLGPYARPAEGTLSQLSQTGITSGKGRVLTLGADQWPAGPLRPNSNISYGVPLAVGYGPLLSSRYASITGADTTGAIPRLLPDSPLMDVLGIRWVAGQYEDTAPMLFGSGCGTQNQVKRVRAAVPSDLSVHGIRVVSHLSCSQQLGTGAVVADVAINWPADSTGRTFPLEAGVHTAEWAYDRSDVKASIAHARAHAWESFDAGGFRGLWFDGSWPIQGAPAGGEIVLTARDEAGAPVKVKSIEVRDAAGKWVPLAFGPEIEAGSGLLSPVTQVAGLPPIRERLGYRGMAWVACRSIVMPLAQMPGFLQAPQSGAGTSRFDALQTVLLEKPLHGFTPTCKGPITTSVVKRSPGHWTLRTRSESPGLLVVSTSFNDGWNATVNDAPAKVVPAYGIVVGIPVPAGDNEVELSFFPRRLLLAIIFGCLALGAALALILASRTASGFVRLKKFEKGKKS